MELNDQIKQELERGFTKSELERIWDLPKNSLSAVLNPENKATLSKKGEIRVKAYFDADPLTRPDPSPRIARGKKTIVIEGTGEEMPQLMKDAGVKMPLPKTTYDGVRMEHNLREDELDLNSETIQQRIVESKKYLKNNPSIFKDLKATTVEENKSKWDFSKVIYLNVEDFTEYPKKDCPPNGYQRTEYLAKKKESDDLIRDAFRNYKNKK